MYGALDVSTSALVAHRTRMNTYAANAANAGAILNAEGEYEPYRRRVPILAAGDPATGSDRGVHVAAIELSDAPMHLRYEPGSPYADENGYVGYPNVDPIVEQINAMEAARSYEANIAAVEATKSMINVALRMIA